jgi:DNA-binding IclR family transcriptional regulator
MLARVRADGFATESGSVTPGLASVACAALDHTGHPAAGIAVTYPSEEVGDAQRIELAGAARACAEELSRRLGHTG